MTRFLNSIRYLHPVRVLAACVLLSCGAAGAWGATYTWKGGSTGLETDWDTASNWNTNAVPTSSDDVVIPAGCTYYPILTALLEVESLTVDAGASLDCSTHSITASSGFTNNGTMRFDGTANTIDSGTASYGASNTIEYYGGGTCAALTGTGAPDETDYINLTVTGSDTVLNLGSESITVAGTLSNEGTITVDGTGVFNLTGTADTDSGLIRYSSTTATTTAIPALSFYNLDVSGGTWTDAAALTVANNMTVSGGGFTASNLITATGGNVSVGGGVVAFNGGVTASSGTITEAVSMTVGGTLTATQFNITAESTLTLSSDTKFSAPIVLSDALTIATGSTPYTIEFGGNVTCTTYALETTGTGTVTVDSGTTLSSTDTLTFDGAVTNKGTISAGNVNLSGDLDNSGGTQFSATGTTALSPSSSLTITGNASDATKTSFSTLSLTGAGGKTLTVSNHITVGTIALSGSDTSNLLTVNSTADSDSIVLTNSNTSALYLSIGGTSSSSGYGPIISTGTITPSSSKCYTSSGYLPSGWHFSTYTWLSTAGSTDWATASNWDNNAIPYTSSDGVVIPSSSNNPIYSSTSNAIIKSLSLSTTGSKFTVSSTGSIQLASTSSPLSNTGTIVYSSSGRIVDNSSVFINDIAKGTVEYAQSTSGTITDYVTGTSSIDYDYYNLTLSGDGTFNNSGATIVVRNTFTTGINSIVNNLTSLIVDGTASIGNTVTTAADQTYTGAVTLKNSTNIFAANSGAGTLTFGTSVDSSGVNGSIECNGNVVLSSTDTTPTVTITSGTGIVTFDGAVTGSGQSLTLTSTSSTVPAVLFKSTAGTSTESLGALSSTGSGAIEFDGTLYASAVTVAGATTIKTSSVTTTGTQTYTGAVTFETDTTLTAYGSATAQLVTFSGTVTGNTHALTLGTVSTAPTNVSFTGTVSGITALSVSGNAVFGGAVSSTGMISVSGTTDINTSSVTTTGTQLYSGDVTLGETADHELTGSGISFSGSVNGTTDGSQNLTIDALSDTGSIAFAGAVGTTVPLGNVAFTGTASFGGSFEQNTANSFTLESGSVSVLQYDFVAGAVSVTSGIFTQTGYNSSDGTDSGTVYAQSVASITTASGTTMNWDSGNAGGSLTVNGDIDAAGTLSFHYKNLTLSGALTVTGSMTLLDLIVADGGSVTIDDGADLNVMRHITLNSSSTFSNTGTGELNLTNTTASVITDKDGVIQDNNTTGQNLGDVVITQGTTAKTFGTAVTADTITMNDTTASAGTVTFDGLLTAGTLTNGTSAVTPSFDVVFDGGVSVTDSVTFYTTGTVTLGGAADDTCTFTGGVTHTAGSTSLAGTLTTSDADASFAAAALTADTAISTVSGTGGSILFGSTVTGSGYALTLTAGDSSNIEFAGAVGTSSASLGAVTVNSAYNVAGDNVTGTPSADAGAVHAASFTQNAGTGTTRLSAVTLTGAMSLTTTAAVDLNGTVTAPSGFSSTGTTFDNTGAAITTTGTALAINHTGAVTVGAALSSGAGTITVTGTGSSYAVSIAGSLNSTTGNIDIDSASTLSVTNTVTATTGTVTVDSSGSTTLSSAADITTTTGNVTFGASKSGALFTAGDITTSGVTADGNGSVTFTNAVTLTGPIALDTTNDGSSTGGEVTFVSTLDSDAAASERALAIDAGTAPVTFTGAAGSTASLASLTLANSGALTFGNALTVSGALTQAAAATGATVFGGSTSTSAATSVGSADLNGTSYTLYGTFAVTSGSMSVTNSGVLLTAPDADITLSSGSFTQDGSGLNQLAGGIVTSDTGAITFAADVYLYGSDTAMQLGGGSGTITCSGNLHIAASTASKTITAASSLTAENIVLYGGTLSLGADITADEDLVLLNGNTSTMYTDSATGLTTLYAYNTSSSPSRSGTSSPSLSSFPTEYPDGTAFIDGSSTAYCGAVTGSTLDGRILTAGQNFYDNGVNLVGTASWTLKLKDNSTAADAFAEAYNCTATYGTVTCTTSDGSAWVAAAEECTNGGNNVDQTDSSASSGWDFTRPALLANNTAYARKTDQTANLSGTYTVYDDVIRVEFVDSADSAANKLVENSGNEISAAVSNISYYSGSALTAFTGTYTDADCTTSTDGQGDLSVFYIKSGTAWNTDATGINAGGSESTNRAGTASSAIPYLNLPKALSSVYATLRDSHKNRIGNYTGTPSAYDYDMDGDGTDDANTSAGAGRFTAVADRAAPVLVAAYTGQETHTEYSGTYDSQPYYDAHNFIELKYSEAVNIGDLTYSDGAVNQQAETSYDSADVHGGALTNNNTSGFTLAGLAAFAYGSVTAGDRTTGEESSVVHSLYRTFSLTAGGTDEIQTHRIRISIAGYVDGTVSVSGSSYRNWIGYIDSATAPSGTVTSIANSYITDTADIPFDDYTTASATTNHRLNTLTVSNTETELYGTWDTSAPSFAPFRTTSSGDSWSSYSYGNAEYYEAIGNTASGGTTLDRIEFHLFDNTPSYNSSDAYVWFSRRGWCAYDTSSSLYTSYSYASDLFGGSRPFDDTEEARTSGGIRYSSVYDSMSAFKYAVGTDADPSISFDTGTAITGGADGTVFSTATDTYNSTGSVDGLYFAVYLSDTTLARKSTFTVSYDADTGFVTDLAGNRLKSATINTLDLMPPEFNMTISPVENDFLYVVFSKALNLTENDLVWIDDSGTRTTLDPLTVIPKGLELIDTGTGTPSSGIAIDEDTPAVKIFESADYTGLMFKLTQDSVLSDIESVYLRVKNIGTSTDPVTGLSGTYVSYIQDSIGNSMTLYDAHAFSDFAVNVVNPQYAYNVDSDSNISDVISSYHKGGSWSVHDWGADQSNYGTLMVGESIFIRAGLTDGTTDNSGGLPANVTAYFDPNPQSNSVSTAYNSDASQSWRIWLPNVTDDVFEALAPANNPLSNTGFASQAGVADDDDETYMDFTLDAGDLSWKSGDQVKFLFGLMDSSGDPIVIRHTPSYSGDSTGGTYSGTEYPLYALRLTKSLSDSDTLAAAGKKIASSLDLWSFKLKSLVSQRGGVTILNNVINASRGESTVVKVTMPSDGSLSVVVMTLDGDIVQYLQHGTASSGDHYYKWNGTTKSGKRVARGMYFVRVFGSGIDETRKVMVVKD